MKLWNVMLIILVFASSPGKANIDHNECITDIYFGNGVWNTRTVAEESKLELANFISENLYHSDETEMFKYHTFQLAYNYHESAALDLMETFYQLRRSGQISDVGYFSGIAAALRYANYEIFTEAFWDVYNNIDVLEGGNVVEMVQQYRNISFNSSHRVILVAHSQGNLFGNRVYDQLDSWQQEYFRMLSIATPSYYVAGNGSYITLHSDLVIAAIPDALPANTINHNGVTGHTFLNAYLAGDASSAKMKDAIRHSINQLKALPSLWEVSQEPAERRECENIRVTMKHRFDASFNPIEGVYPFNESDYKLYSVGNSYVIASCGGWSVENMENGTNGICYGLSGTDEYIFKMDRLIDGVYISVVDSDISYQYNAANHNLLVGSIGDNYWGGRCAVYDRGIRIYITNFDLLSQFSIRQIGFDGTVQNFVSARDSS